MLGAAYRDRRGTWGTELMRGFAAISLPLVGVYPLLPPPGRLIVFFAVRLLAVPCVLFGRRWVAQGRRLPWTLLLFALLIVLMGDVAALMPDDRAVTAGWLLDALGNVVALAAAMTLTLRRGFSHLGGIIDTTVIALAVGGLLWIVIPHQLGSDTSLPAQLNLFVVMIALTGVLGALVHLSQTVSRPVSALRWLKAALGLSIGANAMLAVAGDDPARNLAAGVLYLAAFVAIGLFGLDPSAPVLAHPADTTELERLSAGRLACFGVAAALIPVAVGVRALLGASVDGLLLAVQGTLVSALAMIRIGLLSAQRDRAEQALLYQAAHDSVTGLLNRREFVTRLRREFTRHSRCVVLFCDLDGFKAVNDRYGHSAGDALLVETARRIRSCAPRPHEVSRFGGDEFVVLLIDATRAQALATRDCIIAVIARPFDQVGGVTVGVSVGLAFSDGDTDPEELIGSADRAMYRAKLANRS